MQWIAPSEKDAATATLEKRLWCASRSVPSQLGAQGPGVQRAHPGGELSCDADCLFEFGLCAAAGRCGDGLIQAAEGEACDGAELAGSRCRHHGFFGGSLSCTDGCLFDATGCDPSALEGSAAADWARDLSIDSAGNVFIVGTANARVGTVHHGGSDIVVVKWNVDGARQWVVQLGTSGAAAGFSLRPDSAGTLYVVGRVGGALVWHRQYGSSGDDVGRALALDASDNDLFLMRLTPLAGYSYGQMFGTSNDDYALDLRAFGGKLYLAGNSGGALGGLGSSAGGYDAVVVRYTFAGNREAVLQFGTAYTDQGYSLTDDGTRLYFAGHTEGTFPGNTSAGSRDLFVAKIDPTAMTRVWTVQRGTTSSEDAYRILHLAGSLFVVGSTTGAFPGNTVAGGHDAYWVRLASSDGATQSTRQWGTPDHDIAFGIAPDPSGTVCLSAYFVRFFYG